MFASILNPPIEPDLNTALPLSSILAEAFAIVDGLPAIVAGTNIELAETEPWIVTSLVMVVAPVIVPPVSNTDEPVNCPPADTLNFDDEIIEAGSSISCDDDNWNTLPAAKLEAPIVNPPMVPPASAVIVPCIVTEPSSSKWKLLELISNLSLEPLTNVLSPPKKKLDELITMFPLLPLINCPSLPKKNWSVCTVNSEGFVLNFKNLSVSP